MSKGSWVRRLNDPFPVAEQAAFLRSGFQRTMFDRATMTWAEFLRAVTRVSRKSDSRRIHPDECKMKHDTWSKIRDEISNDIRNGRLSAGDRLPTEAQLADRFDIGRHSVRRALEALAREGKISIEQGRGTFVAETPRLTYHVGKRTRLRRNLISQGVKVTGELIAATRIKAADDVARALHLNAGAQVIESQRITLANDLPVAFGNAYHCAERFPDFAERRDVLGSTTETYRSFGIADYMRLQTSIYSRSAKPDEAKTLKQHPDVPVLIVIAVDATLDGTPISTSRVIWSAARVTFTMEQNDG